MSPSRWPRSPSHGKCSKRDFAAHRGTAAAATSASMRRSTVMRSRATDGMSASECQGKRPDQAVKHRSDGRECREPSTLSDLGFQPVQKTTTIHVSSGFIWGIPVYTPISLEDAGRHGRKDAPVRGVWNHSAATRRGTTFYSNARGPAHMAFESPSITQLSQVIVQATAPSFLLGAVAAF